MTYGDFRRAANVMERLCSPSNATTRESLAESRRERSSAPTQPLSTKPLETRPNEWSSTNMMASKSSDLTALIASDSEPESTGTNPKDLGPSPLDGTSAGKKLYLELATEQRAQIAILAAEFGYRSREVGESIQTCLAKVMEIFTDEPEINLHSSVADAHDDNA